MNQTIQDLIAKLDSRDIDKITQARTALVQLGSSVLEPLIDLLQQGSNYQIANAVVVLGQITDPRCVVPLIRISNHPNLIVRTNLAKALGNFDDIRAKQTLMNMLNYEHEIVQQWVIISLGRFGGSDVVTALTQFLQINQCTTLCHIAIKVLGDIGDSQAVPYIVPFLDNENHHVRTHANLALSALNAKLK
jgi:HEAT repeat protein